MTTFQDQMNSAMGTAGNPYERDGTVNTVAMGAKAGMEHANEFQMWVSQQATSMAKLKIFATMAKNINDQQ